MTLAPDTYVFLFPTVALLLVVDSLDGGLSRLRWTFWTGGSLAGGGLSGRLDGGLSSRRWTRWTFRIGLIINKSLDMGLSRRWWTLWWWLSRWTVGTRCSYKRKGQARYTCIPLPWPGTNVRPQTSDPTSLKCIFICRKAFSCLWETTSRQFTFIN